MGADLDLRVQSTLVAKATATALDGGFVTTGAPVGISKLIGVDYVFGTVPNDAKDVLDGIIVTAPVATGATQLDGTAGNDTLTGLGAKDTISGLAGHDIIDGGAGNDILNGGAGGDIYRFNPGFGNDVVVEEKNPTTLADVTAAARDFVLGPRDNPNDNVIDLSNIKSDTTNPITLTSILSEGRLVTGIFAGNDSFPLEDRQDLLKLQNYSTGEVRIPMLGFLPGQSDSGRTDVEVPATPPAQRPLTLDANVTAEARVQPSTGRSDSSLLTNPLETDAGLTLWVDTGNGTLSEYALTFLRTDFQTGWNMANLVTYVQAKLPAGVTVSAGGLLGSSLVFTVKQDGTTATRTVDGVTRQYYKPARILVLPNAGQTNSVVTADHVYPDRNAALQLLLGSAEKSLKYIDEIITGDANNTFLFGNDWGSNYLLGKYEPDILTGFWSRNQELTIDTSATVNNNRKLVLDFRNVSKELSFTFSKNDFGGTTLTVTRKAQMIAGLPKPSVLFQLLDANGEFITTTNPPTVPATLREVMVQKLGETLTAAIGNFLDGFIPDEVEFNKLTFTNVGFNTIVLWRT